MKKRILTIATMLFLAIMIPLTVNAATISAEPTEMKVGDIVTVTVEVNTADTEAVQFDLDFDDSKYEYVLGSAESELDSTESNLLDKDTVRVSAFNFDTNATAQKVTLKFKARNAGTSVPFKVVDGTLEATSTTGATTMETFADAEVIVKKIEGIPNPEKDKPVYLDPNGKPIGKHDPTGEAARTTTRKSIAGVYTKLISGKLVVPYALPTSDDILTIEDIKAEFGNNVDVTGLTNPVKSGDTFTLDGKQHTVLIYGDVNKDGKVTTADALIIRKYEKNVLTPDEVTSITSEVANPLEDSKAVQQFVLRLRQTATKTILDKYPVEFVASDIAITPNTKPVYRGEKTLIATISTIDGRNISNELISIAKVSNVTIETVENAGNIDVYATPNNSDTFNLVASLQGNNIENGKITKDPQAIDIEEVKTVTDIALFTEDGSKEITDNVTMRLGGSDILRIKYYHTYPDGTKVELTDELAGAGFFNANNVKLQLPANAVLQRADLAHNNSTTADTRLTLNSILLLSTNGINTVGGTDVLTLTVQNNLSFYGNTTGFERIFTKNITVDILPEGATAITINGETKTNNTSINMNIYNTEQPNNDHVQLMTNDYGSSYYTIIDFNLLYGNKSAGIAQSLCGSSLKMGDEENPLLKRVDSLIVYENADPNDSLDIDVKFMKKYDTGYQEVGGHLSYIEADAIAISCFDTSDFDNADIVSNLENGITIIYGGTKNADGTINRNKLNINVKCVDGTKTPSKVPAATTPAVTESPAPSVEPTTTTSPSTTATPSTTPDVDEFDDPFGDVDSDFQDVTITTSPSTTTEPSPTVPVPTADPNPSPSTLPSTSPNTSPEVDNQDE